MKVDYETYVKIQSRVASWSNDGRDIYEEDSNSEYNEGFVDCCIIFWEEARYDRIDVLEAVDAAVAEIKRVHA